jgi:hypothetical protein
MDDLERSLRELEQALGDVRAGAARVPAVEPKGTPSADGVSEAERRLTALSAALAAAREAAKRLDDVANVALGQEGRRVVRLQRALAQAEAERPAAVAAERSPAPTRRARRQRRRALAFAPGVVVAGAAATVLASVAIDNTVNPFGTPEQSPTLPAERAAPQPLTIAPRGSAVTQPAGGGHAGPSGRHHKGSTPASTTAADSAARAATAPAGGGLRRFAGLPSLRRPAATPSQPDRPSPAPRDGGGQAPAATPTPAPAPVTVPPAPATPAVDTTVTVAASTPAVQPPATPPAPTAVAASVTASAGTVAPPSVKVNTTAPSLVSSVIAALSPDTTRTGDHDGRGHGRRLPPHDDPPPRDRGGIGPPAAIPSPASPEKRGHRHRHED